MGLPPAHERGRKAEQVTAEYLEGLGCVVLDRNVRVGSLELDLLVRDGTTLAVVEVRTRGRGSWASALASVTATKQKRLRHAASVLWAQRYSKHADLERVRFDVAAVSFESASPRVDYVRAAFV